MIIVKNPNMKEAARNLTLQQIFVKGNQIIMQEMADKIIINKKKDKVPLPLNNDKEKMKAAQLQKMWKCFFGRQLLLTLVKSNLSESWGCCSEHLQPGL